MYQGIIIAPVIDGRMIGIDAETGKPVWETRVAWAQDNYTLTMAPRIAKGNGASLVIINRDPTPLDATADAVIRRPIGETLTALLARMAVA